MTMMTSDELDQQKEIQYYASGVNAWFNTSLEHDRSILTLAAGGIGLLLTLLTSDRLPSSAEALVLYIGAIACFLVAIIAILFVFRRNRTHIEQVFAGKISGSDKVLEFSDSVAKWSFGVGVLFTAVIGLSAAITSYSSKEKTMTDPSKPVQKTEVLREVQNPPSGTPTTESFNNMADLTKSFNNMSSVKPQSGSSTPATSSSQPTGQQAPATQNQGQTKSGP